MTRRHKQSYLLLAAALLLACTWFVQMPLTGMQQAHRLSPAVQEPFEVIPILVLGGFRGVVVDFLWIRGMARHDEKRFFELKTIFDLIANLQPNIPDVWIFQGWNMAYNIAHNMQTKEGKWKWVKAGLEYMERGVPKNPTSGEIPAYLGHMYRHKFNPDVFPLARVQYYRKQLAKQGTDNFEQAIKFYREAIAAGLRVTTESVVARAIAHTHRQAAWLAKKEGRWDDVISNLEKSFAEWKAYAKEYGSDKLWHSNIANVALELGRTYFEIAGAAEADGHPDRAAECFRKAAQRYRFVVERLGVTLYPSQTKQLKFALKKVGKAQTPPP